MDLALDALEPPYLLLEDRLGPAATGRLYHHPIEVIRCDDPGQLDESLERIERGLARGLHAAGLLSYELGYALEPRLAPLMPERRRDPLLWFGLFAEPDLAAPGDLDAAFATLAPPPPISHLSPGHSEGDHVEKVRQALELIGAGDVYQVNLTFPMRFRYAGDPLALYAALRTRQPVAHGGFARLVDRSVLSVSPELWIDVADGRAVMRPMKGTAPRGANPAEDALAKHDLLADPKQRAENLMIVDLLRNDLARISQPESVGVPELFTVETYPSFHTMTSTVVSTLRPGGDLRTRLAALFPCGSIVGAPKIRAGEIIRALEDGPRGAYTGALGRIAPDGEMRFNVAIRTAVINRDGSGQYGVGGGVVADSDPRSEYAEALLKARVLTELAEDFDLIETFRWSATDGFVRLALHLDRLEASAQALGFHLDRPDIDRSLADLALAFGGGADQRVRLVSRRSGQFTLSSEAAAPAPDRPLRVAVSALRVDAGDPFLRHKTTRRALYDAEFQRAAAAGLDEVLFVNQRDEVAEASRNTVFAEIDGRLKTPPISCGLLPGIYRRAALEQQEATTAILSLQDLRGAAALFLGNSLNGLRPIVLADS